MRVMEAGLGICSDGDMKISVPGGCKARASGTRSHERSRWRSRGVAGATPANSLDRAACSTHDAWRGRGRHAASRIGRGPTGSGAHLCRARGAVRRLPRCLRRTCLPARRAPARNDGNRAKHATPPVGSIPVVGRPGRAVERGLAERRARAHRCAARFRRAAGSEQDSRSRDALCFGPRDRAKAGSATSSRARIELYAQLLTTCAGCHAKLGGGPTGPKQ